MRHLLLSTPVLGLIRISALKDSLLVILSLFRKFSITRPVLRTLLPLLLLLTVHNILPLDLGRVDPLSRLVYTISIGVRSRAFVLYWFGSTWILLIRGELALLVVHLIFNIN